MNQYPYLNAGLQCMQHLYPPRGLIHIGAGSSDMRPYPFAHVPQLFIAAPDENRYKALKAKLAGHPNAQLVQTVVAGYDGVAAYFEYSLAKESSLCTPDLMQSLWANIKVVRTNEVPASTLVKLMNQCQIDGTEVNWLVIDCLPAGAVLQTSGDILNQLDVLVVRALQDAPMHDDAQAAALPGIRQTLQSFGLVLAAVEEENHPQLVRALFLRDNVQQLANEKSAVEAERAELQRALDVAKSQLAAEFDAKAEAQTQCAELSKRSAEVVAQRFQLRQQNASLAAEKAALTTARDEQATAAAQRLANLQELQTKHNALQQQLEKSVAGIAELTSARDHLSQQRDAEAQARAQAIAQRDAEAAAKQQALTQRDQLAAEKAALATARDEQANAAAQRLASLQELQTKHNALQQQLEKSVAGIAELTSARDHLSQQRDAEAQARAQAIAQRDAEVAAKQQALTQRDQLAAEKAALATARDEQAKLAADRQTSIIKLQQDSAIKQQRFYQLETENQDLSERQNLFQEELIKAETQIELIKDLLLREPGI